MKTSIFVRNFRDFERFFIILWEFLENNGKIILFQFPIILKFPIIFCNHPIIFPTKFTIFKLSHYFLKICYYFSKFTLFEIPIIFSRFLLFSVMDEIPIIFLKFVIIFLYSQYFSKIPIIFFNFLIF